MFSNGTAIYIQACMQAEERVLYPAVITEVNDGVLTVAVQAEDVSFEVGVDTMIYFDHKRDFMQAPVRIDAILQSESEAETDDIDEESTVDSTRVIAISITGEAVSAESRRSFRVTTVMADLFTTVGEEEKCQLLDVSATGFSIRSKQSHPIGTVLNVTLRHEGKQYTGKATIQGVKVLKSSNFRYGMHSQEDNGSATSLCKGQQTISMAVQRQQLKRMQGAA